jgi:hypothetical protein
MTKLSHPSSVQRRWHKPNAVRLHGLVDASREAGLVVEINLKAHSLAQSKYLSPFSFRRMLPQILDG